MPPRFFSRWLPIALFISGQVYGQSADSVRVAFQVDSLIQISRAFTAKGNLEEALAVNEMAAHLARSQQGERSPVFANTCFNRGRVLFLAGGPGYYREAEEWYLLSRDIREVTIGKDHLDYTWSVNNLGLIYENEGQYAKALELYNEALSIRSRQLGELHPLYFGSVGNIANLLWKMGRLDEAL
ncbi:MAG: tetratricopeptide repeat protein, partial [Saprospiraceae bacterium]|nr:tetratricopeptide repeat protein [Saprospiraceae bacterium]